MHADCSWQFAFHCDSESLSQDQAFIKQSTPSEGMKFSKGSLQVNFTWHLKALVTDLNIDTTVHIYQIKRKLTFG